MNLKTNLRDITPKTTTKKPQKSNENRKNMSKKYTTHTELLV